MSTLAAFPPIDFAVSASRSSQGSTDCLVSDVSTSSSTAFVLIEGKSDFTFFAGTLNWAQLASVQARRDAIDALLHLEPRYRERNWNGEGAEPVPEAAFQEALAFLLELPATIPLPEVNAEPDGYLGLEWYVNKWLNYVVSFNGTGALSCSGLYDRLKTYGTWYMDNGIPGEILRMIARTVR